MTCCEVEYRIRRLLDEAARERLVAHRPGFREHFGGALIAIGRSLSGSEPTPRPRPALPVRCPVRAAERVRPAAGGGRLLRQPRSQGPAA